MSLFKWLTSTASGLMLVSCVTINIYFPAAAAEKAADQIIEDVWDLKQTMPEQSEPILEEQSQYQQQKRSNIAITLLNWFIAPAAAVELNLDISSSAIAALESKMKARHQILKPYYDNGAIGLTSNGLITVRDAKAIALKERNKVNGLVADENKDRDAMYAEIARANGHPEWRADIQSTFANRWISNAPSGWWYQSSGGWKQK